MTATSAAADKTPKVPKTGETRKTRQDVLKDFRTDQIVQAAWEVIGSLGYAEASIDRIAERAGVARSTVYVYLGSKEEILDACFARGRVQLGERIRSAFQAAEGLEGRLAAFLGATLAYVDENREFFMAVLALHGIDAVFAGQEDVDSRELASLRDETQALVLGLFEEGTRAGVLHDDSARLGDWLGTLLYGALVRRAYQRQPLPAADEAAALASLFLHGVANRDRA